MSSIDSPLGRDSTRGDPLAPLSWDGPWTRFLFFTGKGGVGKTTIACCVALRLAELGKAVLLVSTDPASNLDDVLGVSARTSPTPVPGSEGLSVMNIDPDAAAAAYRDRVLGPLRGRVPAEQLLGVQEQLSGQCTVEIAAFDEFTGLLSDPQLTDAYDHVIFDTAPTGHTLRLLSLPSGWSDYIETNPEGASCLGPLAGLSAKREQYEHTVSALSDPAQTTVVLVSAPNASALSEAARAARELSDLGIANQQLVVNGLLRDGLPGDPVAHAFTERQDAALDSLPDELAGLPTAGVPLADWDVTGPDALAALTRNWSGLVGDGSGSATQGATSIEVAAISSLIDELASAGRGVIMVIGKGGVGKTTAATAIAHGLARLDHDVHLSTTDPAGRLAELPADERPARLTVGRIDPTAEVERYTAEKLRRAEPLEPSQRALLEEDLRSPCTEEIAVFQAFSRLLGRGRRSFVVIDTAPTGHTRCCLTGPAPITATSSERSPARTGTSPRR
jgi:arsenite-transporting ATPase